MPGKNCKNCARHKQCQKDHASWLFLFIGLIATVAVRLVNVILGASLFWAKFAWYIGITGFFIYFLYKYLQSRSIRNFLINSHTEEKLRNNQLLTAAESQFLASLFCSLRNRKEIVNNFFIFFTSGLALVWGVYQDFFLK